MSRVDDALLLRDTIQRIVDDKLGKERPKSSYALVTGFNPDEGTVSVIFDGDDITVDIPAGSIYPSEIGQTVRVGGSSGAKVIEDVMGENLTEVKAREAQATADGKNTVNYGETPPEGTDHKDGDIWFDEGNSNMPNVWKDGGWVSIEDLRVAAIEAAQAELREDLDTVVENGVGTKSFYKPTQPTEAESKEGDLWFDTSEGGNNELHTYVNGVWVSAADARIAAIAQAQAELASDLEDVVTNGLGTKTFYKPTQPAVADSKDGDLWFDTSTAGKNALHVFTGGAWVSAADARLAELKDAQTQMTGDISAAQQKADEAFQDAADADSKAVTAQSAADAAADAAASAAGIANGKGKVLVQSTAPGAADRNAQTLWIDTTGGANTPKRWVSGTTWSAVTDKAATDAASAAATAKSAADAAKSAADAAQATATNAQTAASNAQSTATEALTSANSKNTVTRSTADPTTPYAGRVDDIWWKMSTMSSGGRVIAQYRWNGTAWLTETIDNAVIANLDAAKITTGYLAAARIKANTLNADTVLINGSLGSIILRDGAITTPKIAVGAITAESGVVASLDAGKITVGTLDVARLGANSITADKLLIGGDRNFVANGDLTAGSTVGWPSAFVYQTTSVPPGFEAAADITGTSTAQWMDTKYSVFPGDVVVYEIWVKADKPNSRIYHEVRTQDGSNLANSANRWTSVQGGGPDASYVYPVANYVVPTVWTKLISKITVRDGVSSIYLRSFYPNHSAGTERTATISVTGIKLYRQVGATLIEPGAITTEKIAVGAITAESGVVASLDAGKITVGTLDVARLAAGSITADKVLLGDSGNVFNDPKFAYVGGYGPHWSVVDAGIEMVGVGAQRGTYFYHTEFPVMPGEKIRVAAKRTTLAGAATGDVTIYVRPFVGSSWGSATAAIRMTSDGDAVGEATMPAGATKACFGFFIQSSITSDQRVRLSDVMVRRMTGSTLIEPGAITTEKLATGAITAESGVIGSLDASKITVGKLSGARLEADAINGMQIIGATIATSTGFPRVQLDNAGLHVYKSSSVRSFFADSATGDLDVVGNFRTGTSGTRIEMTQSTSTSSWGSYTSGVELFALGGGTVDSVALSYSVGASVRSRRLRLAEGSGFGMGSLEFFSGGMVGATASAALKSIDANSESAQVFVGGYGSSGYASITTGSSGSTGVVAKASDNSVTLNASSVINLNAPTITGLPIATGDGVDFPTVAANGGSQTVTINFPSGKFSVAPSVSAMTSHGRVTPVVFNITKTGFSFRVWNFTSSSAPSVVGSWMAVAAS